MGLFSEQPDQGGIGATVGKMADGFSKLVVQHIALARAELAQDARGVGTDLARLALFLPFLLVGYALCCAALAAGLSRRWGVEASLWAVGGANLLGGAVGTYWMAVRLMGRQVLRSTREEFNRSAAALDANPEEARDGH